MTNKKKSVDIGKKETDSLKRFLRIPLSMIDKAPWNYKVDDDLTKEKLKNNILRNGQIINGIVREMENGRFEMVDGNHRIDAMLETNHEDMICFNLGVISIDEAKRIAIEVNETRFDTDHIKLASRIKELSGIFTFEELSLTMPYSEDDLTNMVKLLDYDFDKISDQTDDKELPPDGKKIVHLVLDDNIYNQWLEFRHALEVDSDEEAFEELLIRASD